MTYAILTVSDRVFAGTRTDQNRPRIETLMEPLGSELVWAGTVPDVISDIQRELIRLCDEVQVNLIVTNGGTGLSPRDVTPEATRPLCSKEAPGLAELMRWMGFQKTKKAALSRQFAGLRGRTLILNLPGSPAGVEESLGAVLELLPHVLELQDSTPHSDEP